MFKFYLTNADGSCKPELLGQPKPTWDKQLWLFGRTEQLKSVAIRVQGFDPSFLMRVDGWSPTEIKAFEAAVNEDSYNAIRRTVIEKHMPFIGFSGERQDQMLRVYYKNPSKLGYPGKDGADGRGMYKAMGKPMYLSKKRPAENVRIYNKNWTWENQFLYENSLTMHRWLDIRKGYLRPVGGADRATNADIELTYTYKKGSVTMSQEQDGHRMLNAAVSMRVYRSDKVPVDHADLDHMIVCMATRIYWTGVSRPAEDYLFKIGTARSKTTEVRKETGVKTTTCVFTDMGKLVTEWYTLVNKVHNVDNIVFAGDHYRNFLSIMTARCQGYWAQNPYNLGRFKGLKVGNPREWEGRFFNNHWGRNMFDLVDYMRKQFVSPPLDECTLYGAVTHPEFYKGPIDERFRSILSNEVLRIGRTMEGIEKLSGEIMMEIHYLHAVESKRNGIIGMGEGCAQTTTSLTAYVSRGQAIRTYNKICQQAHPDSIYINREALRRAPLLVPKHMANSLPEKPHAPNIPLRSKLGKPPLKARLPFSKKPGKKRKTAGESMDLSQMFKKRSTESTDDGSTKSGDGKTVDATVVADAVGGFMEEEEREYVGEMVADNSSFLGKSGKFAGGLVVRPMSGHYWEWFESTGTLDFASLYPSIVNGYKLCYSHCIMVGDSTSEGDDDFTWLVHDPVRAKKYLDEKGWQLLYVPLMDSCAVFVVGKRVQHSELEWSYENGPKSLLPNTIDQLVKQRRSVKKRMEAATEGTFEHAVLNSQQLECKVCQNAMYGYLGNTKGGNSPIVLSYPVLSAAVCSIGQMMNKYVQHLLITKYNATVVYGDTDSVMIQVPPPPGMREDMTIEERRAIWWPLFEEMAKQCQQLYPKPNDLEFEALKENFILYMKKNYATFAIEREDPRPKVSKVRKAMELDDSVDDEGVWTAFKEMPNPKRRKMFHCTKDSQHLDIKGLPGKKRDRCLFVRKLNERMVEMLLEHAPQEEIEKYLHQQMTRLIELKVPMSDLVISCEMKEKYKTKTPPIQVRVARKMYQKGILVQGGMRISYVLIKGKTMKGVEGEVPGDAKMEDIDVHAYLDSQLRVVVDTLTLFRPDVRTHQIYLKYLHASNRAWNNQAALKTRKRTAEPTETGRPAKRSRGMILL